MSNNKEEREKRKEERSKNAGGSNRERSTDRNGYLRISTEKTLNGEVPHFKGEEVSDEQIAKCFGKYKNCVQNCRLRALCNSKAKENEEEQRRQRYRETGYIDDMDAGGNHVAPEFCLDPAQEDGSFDDEVFAAIDQLDISDRCRREVRSLFRTKLAAESAENAVKELLRRLGEIYVNDATGFEVMFFQILAGGNQVELAKRRGCSKQNINKIVMRGRERLAAYREMVRKNPDCRLTCRELAVYHAVELCGMTYREAGSIIGVSHTIVKRCFQKMRLKGVKVSKKRPGRRKSNKKATAKVRDIYG